MTLNSLTAFVAFVASCVVGSFAGAQVQVENLGGLPQASRAIMVSGDGSVLVIASQAIGSGATVDRYFRWTVAGGAVETTFVPGAATSDTDLVGINTAGTIVVGNRMDLNRGFRWSALDGTTTLEPLLGDSTSIVFDLSGDGSIVVGASRGVDSQTQLPVQRLVVWSGTSGQPQLLDPMPGTLVTSGDDYGVRISRDGTTILARADVSGSANFAVPGNDDCLNAVPIGLGATAFSTIGATTDGANPTEPQCGPVTGSFEKDIWFTHLAGSTGPLTLTTCPASFDTRIDVLTGCGGTLIACNDDDNSCSVSGLSSTLTFNVTAGQSYLIRLGGYFGAEGNGTLILGMGAVQPDIHLFRWTTVQGESLWEDLGMPGDGLASPQWVVNYQLNGDGTKILATRIEENGKGSVTRVSRWSTATGWQVINAVGTRIRGDDISDDGLTVVGTIDDTQIFVWSLASGISIVGTPPTNLTHFEVSTGISSDGLVMAGRVDDLDAVGPTSSFRWSQAGGFQEIPPLLGDAACELDAISDDCSVLVGASGDAIGANPMAFRWTSAAMVGIPGLPHSSQANAISSDGSVALGRDRGQPSRLIRWSDQSGIAELLPLPGDSSAIMSDGYGTSGQGVIRAMSDDGAVVAGTSYGPTAATACLWVGTQPTSLGHLPGFESVSFATAVSGDGSAVVGYGETFNTAIIRNAFRWKADALVNLGTVVSGDSVVATAANHDGSIIVGTSTAQGAFSQPVGFRWTSAGGIAALGVLPGFESSWPLDVSADGSVVIGHSGQALAGAFRWTANGMVNLGVLPNYSGASADLVSRDGNVVVGVCTVFNSELNRYLYEVFHWSGAVGMVGLGPMTAWSSMNADGSVVVGSREGVGAQADSIACLWTAQSGVVDLAVYLTGIGLDLSGWTLIDARLSRDGTTIATTAKDSSGRTTTLRVTGVPLQGGPPVPSVPTGVLASDGTSTDGVIVTWTASELATGYLIFRDGSATEIGTVGLQTSFTDVTALPGVAHSYSVRATNTTGASDQSLSDSGYRNLLAPAVVSASDGAFTDRVEVTWSAVAGAVSYEVLRSDLPQPLGSAKQMQFSDTTAMPGAANIYKVRALGIVGVSDTSIAEGGFRQIAAPTLVAATAGTFTDRIDLSWSGAVGATGYRIYRDGFASEIGSVEGTTAFTDFTASPGVMHFYIIVGFNSVGSGAVSAEVMGYRNLLAPTGVSCTTGLIDRVRVAWTGSLGAMTYQVFRDGVLLDSTGVTTFDDLTAAIGVNYTYSVKASGGLGLSDFSTGAIGWRAPGSPTLVSASDGASTDSVTVTWSAIEGATGYKVLRSDTGLIATVGVVTTFTDFTAVPGTEYFYSVVATTLAGDSAESASDSGYRNLLAPTGVSCTTGLIDRVRVAWTGSLGAMVYQVFRDGVLLDSTGVTTYDDLTAAIGVTYTYSVKAAGGPALSDPSAGAVGWRAPASPTGVSALDGMSTASVTVTWTAVEGATGYKILRSGTGLIATVGVVTTFTDSTAVPGTPYIYSVIATTAAGDSAESASDSGYRNLLAPTGVLCAGGLTDRIRISWNSSVGAVAYQVFRDGVLLDSTGVTTFDDLAAAIGVNYTYSLKAAGSVGLSDFSTGAVGWRAPASPLTVSATDGTSTASVTVTWSTVQGATGYKVIRVGSQLPIGTVGAATTFTDFTAVPGAEYFYSVVATTLAGDSAESVSDSGYRNLLAPTGVAASDGTFTDRVDVTWNPVTGAVSYELSRSDLQLPLGSAITPPFSDATAVPGTLYTYKVKAKGTIGTSASSAGNTGYRAIGPPVDVAASDGAFTDRVLVTWTSVPGATGYKIFRNGGATAIGTVGPVTSFSDTTAMPGTTYSYTVKLIVAAGTSGPSAPDSGWRNVAAPVGVSATDGSFEDKVIVTWTASVGASGYQIFRGEGSKPIGTVGDSLTFADSTALPGTPYSYTVRGVIGAGLTLPSTADVGYANVAAPVGVVASDGTSVSHVALSWGASPGAIRYLIYRSGWPTALAVVESLTTYLDTTASPGVAYTYTVKSQGIVGASGASVPDGGHRSVKAPTGVSASDGTLTGKVAVAWTASFAAVGYKIYRDRSETALATVLGPATTFNDESALPGTLHLYAVTAVGAIGESALSAEDSGFRNLLPPTGVAASNGTSSTAVDLSWIPSQGAVGYKIYRGGPPSEGELLATVGAVASFSDGLAQPGAVARYRIQALGVVGVSEQSAPNMGYRNLLPPINVAATDIDPAKVRVTWEASTQPEGAPTLTGFEVWRTVGEDDPMLVAVTDAQTLLFDDISISVGIVGHYAVKARFVLGGIIVDESAATNPSLPDDGVRPLSWSGGGGGSGGADGDEGGLAGGDDSSGVAEDPHAGDGDSGAAGDAVDEAGEVDDEASSADEKPGDKPTHPTDKPLDPCEQFVAALEECIKALDGNPSMDELSLRLRALFEETAPGEAACCALARGDVTLDGVVDEFDVAAFIDAWHADDLVFADLDRDGAITVTDLLIVTDAVDARAHEESRP